MYRRSLSPPQCVSPHLGRTGQVRPLTQRLLGILQVLTLALSPWLPLCSPSHAEPTTWFEPIQTVTGNTGSQFGSAVACSDTVTSIGHSYIAVGAPLEASGDGRVHIVGPTGVIQTLTPPTAGELGHFGYAVAFATDINGDYIPELLIGEPDVPGGGLGGGGAIHVFRSTVVNLTPYAVCYTVTNDFDTAFSFGSFILPTSAIITDGFEVVVSNVNVPSVRSFRVTYAAPYCNVVSGPRYNSPGNPGSRYGQALGEIPGLQDNNVLAGAPYQAVSSGGVNLLQTNGNSSVLFPGPAPSTKAGVAVASRVTSMLFGLNAPGASETDTIHIGTETSGTYAPVCSLSLPISDLSDFAGQSLAHLDNVFKPFLSYNNGASFASYRSEADTGGSVGLLGAEGAGGCTTVKEVNNCVRQAGQKQGFALAGGPFCTTTGGTKVLVVGAPGFSSDAGRIDLYAEGSQFDSARVCGAPTSTPTPTPTNTPLPDSSPAVSPTATPAPGVFTPIPVSQNTGNLPPPTAVGDSTTLTITAPILTLSPNAPKGLSLAGYRFTVTQTSTAASVSTFSFEESPFEALSRASSKKRQIITKRNQITLRKLGKGTYSITYQAVFSQKTNKGTKRIFGKLSAARVVAVR